MEEMFSTEVRTEPVPFERWLKEYCKGEKFAKACAECPYYGKRWSCPPDMPSVRDYFSGMETVFCIGVKVMYSEAAIRESEKSPEREEEIRTQTYEVVKKRMLRALLALETAFPGAKSIMAGGCLLCYRCAREYGRPCYHPDKMRYSYSGFGFDLGQIAAEVLGMPLLWRQGGLPRYHVAIASILMPQRKNQEF